MSNRWFVALCFIFSLIIIVESVLVASAGDWFLMLWAFPFALFLLVAAMRSQFDENVRSSQGTLDVKQAFFMEVHSNE